MARQDQPGIPEWALEDEEKESEFGEVRDRVNKKVKKLTGDLRKFDISTFMQKGRSVDFDGLEAALKELRAEAEQARESYERQSKEMVDGYKDSEQSRFDAAARGVFAGFKDRVEKMFEGLDKGHDYSIRFTEVPPDFVHVYIDREDGELWLGFPGRVGDIEISDESNVTRDRYGSRIDFRADDGAMEVVVREESERTSLPSELQERLDGLVAEIKAKLEEVL